MATNYKNNNRNSNNSGNSQKKHSGCKAGIGKNGKTYLQGWNYSKRHGMVTFVASMKNDKNMCVNKHGEESEIYVVSITVPMQPKRLVTGFLKLNDGKLRMPDLGMTANPKAPNGGYWGKTAMGK